MVENGQGVASIKQKLFRKWLCYIQSTEKFRHNEQRVKDYTTGNIKYS